MFDKMQTTPNNCEIIIRRAANVEFGAVQKHVNFFNDSPIILQSETLLGEVGFGTADNGPSKVCVNNRSTTNPRSPPPPVKSRTLAALFRLRKAYVPIAYVPIARLGGGVQPGDRT